MPPTNGRPRRVLGVEELERMKVKDLDDLLKEHGFQKGKQKKKNRRCRLLVDVQVRRNMTSNSDRKCCLLVDVQVRRNATSNTNRMCRLLVLVGDGFHQGTNINGTDCPWGVLLVLVGDGFHHGTSVDGTGCSLVVVEDGFHHGNVINNCALVFF